jgi:uncharacterized membrane protein YkvA (DUF1232 family)
VLSVYCVARDSRTPRFVRLFSLLVAAYAFSPLDLIPDFIPVLGYLDDLLLIPLGVWLIIRLTPPEILAVARASALKMAQQPVSYSGAVIIAVIWFLALVFSGYWLYSAFRV